MCLMKWELMGELKWASCTILIVRHHGFSSTSAPAKSSRHSASQHGSPPHYSPPVDCLTRPSTRQIAMAGLPGETRHYRADPVRIRTRARPWQLSSWSSLRSVMPQPLATHCDARSSRRGVALRAVAICFSEPEDEPHGFRKLRTHSFCGLSTLMTHIGTFQST